MSGVKRTITLALALAGTCLALGATANAALAIEWVVNGKTLPEGENYALPCEQAGAVKLSVPGAMTLSAAEASCPGWVIFNSGGNAFSTGRILLEEVSVEGAPACEAANIETNVLTGKAIAAELESKLAVTYKPQVGTSIGLVSIEGCALEGEYPITGTTAAEVEEENVFLHIQPYEFSAEVSEITGDALQVGSRAASLNGVLDFEFH